MHKVSRSKRTAPRERTATPAELADETERCRRAREKARQATEPEPEGNLAKCLVTFARWRKCCVCGSLTLFVNTQARTDGDVECPSCVRVRENIAKRLRPSLPMRAALHLRSLFSTANDNHEVQHAS
jgi:hypothetical protein